MHTDDDHWQDAEASADYVALSLPGFWKAVREGRLPKPAYPLPRAPRWRPSELLAALEQTRAMPAEQMATRKRARDAAVMQAAKAGKAS